MSDFSNFELGQLKASPAGVYGLADNLLPEMALAVGFTLSSEPYEEEIRSFIGYLGPAKTLQDNIELVQERLDSADSALTIAADWVERSGVLAPLNRSFADNAPAPTTFDVVVWSGGVANWMLRRAAVTERLDPAEVGTVTIPVGNRQMGPAEHQLVKTFAKSEGRLPTEADFIENYILSRLARAGFRTHLVRTESNNAEAILDELFATERHLLNGSIIVPGNAPNTIQAAGELRLAAKRAYGPFDFTGNQVYTISDSIPVARQGEGTATHQNPFSALGQIIRNALLIHRNL